MDWTSTTQKKSHATRTTKQVASVKTLPKLTPSQLIKKQLPGQTLDTAYVKPRITEFLNIGDFSINRESCVPIEEPLFEPIPSIIRFTDYEPLQIKSTVFKLRNKDKVARTVRIIQPESRLFQVSLYSGQKDFNDESAVTRGSKVAPGLEVCYLIKFSPEAKTDYNYDLQIVTERERFVVPIVALGKRAMIDFPDTINFGKDCPVKYVTEKPVIIRNLGDKTTKWELVLPNGFSADKKEGVLEFGRSEQIILKFYPVEKKLYEDEATLKYDSLEAFIPITGNAINGKVFLSKRLVKLGDSYIGLENQRTIEIVNHSNVKIDFEWRSFETEAEEFEKKEMIKRQLDEEEQVQKLMLRDAAALEDNPELLDIQDDDDSGYEEVDERTLMLTNQKKAELLLQRRYKGIKKSIEENLFLFDDDFFNIEPVKGTIWPKSEMTITVSFRPKTAKEYKIHAYCNISCSDSRLSLALEGTGLGPKAYLSSQSLNIKEVCVNERKDFPLFIENKGDIPARFTLMPNNTPFAKMIDFSEKSGVLEVGQKVNFWMTFQSSKVGEFQEVFKWKLEGSGDKDDLSLHVRGHVRAPEFEFRDKEINFGTVSYMFDKTKEIVLENKSPVKFSFNLRIPGDSRNKEKEFEIDPDNDDIKPNESKTIKIRFMPHQKTDYFMVMVLDIGGVGKDMKSIPITAKSAVPKVVLKENVLRYGEVFLRDPKDKEVLLINQSDLPARFKVIPQSPDNQMIGKIHTDNEDGIIPPYGQYPLKVTLTTMTISDDINLDLAIRIIADEDKPLNVKILAKSSGPKVSIKQPAIDFGDVQVLDEKYAKIYIENKSDITADFYAFTKLKDSIFKPIQRHHHLDANSSMEVEIACNADDNKIFTDTLHFVIKEGVDLEVKLKARGVGNTIFCKDINFKDDRFERADKMDKIDFGTNFTFTQKTKEFFLENRGRRNQLLQWVRKQPDKKKEEDDKRPQQISKKKVKEEEPTITFSIFPEEKLIPKKHGIMFQFRAVSAKKGRISEVFILQSTIEGDRKPTKLGEVEITGEFINPRLTFDLQDKHFVYDWVKGVPPKTISRNIGITCDSVLPTKFKLIVEKPFSIYPDNFDLSAFKKVTARIDFDPTFRTNKKQGNETRDLKVKHSKHPFQESIELVGVYNFPNLDLETRDIDFGSVLNDTSKKVIMKMKNISKMNVEYQWSFLEDEVREERDPIPINEIFDILPLNGVLEPGQTENVEFVYYGLPGRRFEAKAICQIEGGPEEKVNLVGESSKIDYHLIFPGSSAKNEIEFKEIPFSQWSSRDFFIQNLGKVPFDFKVKTDGITRKGLVIIKPSSGKIAGGGKSRIRVNFCPGLPGDYLEKFKIQVAHFEAETIFLRGFGQYPALKFELNRQVDDDLRRKLEDEGQTLDNVSIDSQTSSITKKFPDGEMISRVDRKILSDAVMKNIEDRAKGALSLDSTVAADNKDDLAQTIPEPRGDDENPLNVTNAASTTARSGFMRGTFVGNKYEKALYDNIVVGTYFIDLGNVIAGSQAQYQFRVYNVGKLPQITILFDQKYIKAHGFRLNPDKVILKNKEKNYEDIRLQFATKKNTQTGRQTFLLPVEIENGPKYIVEIHTNVTVPELGFSNQEIDFGKVISGQKKIKTLRISNDKDVDCTWSIVPRKEQKKRLNEPAAENKFTITPSSGVLPSKGKLNIEISFMPTGDRMYNNVFEVSMEDNQKKLELLCIGQGITPQLQFFPEEMIFDPCLPYDSVYKCLEIKNNSEFDVELFSTDFDKQYPEEEKMLSLYEPLLKQDLLSMSVRKPGESLWPEIRSYYSVIKDNQLLNEEINKVKEDKSLTNEQIAEKIDELEKTRKVPKGEVKYPMALSQKEKTYVVVWGPEGSGKTSVAQTIAKEHQRGYLRFADLLDWNMQAGTQAGLKAKEYLEKRVEEKDIFVAEKEKLKKKQPKKKGQEEENLYLERFSWVTDDMLVELLAERLKSKDFNAGVVFDDIKGDFFENEMVALKAILKVCKEGQTYFLNMTSVADSEGNPQCLDIDPKNLDELERLRELKSKPEEMVKKKRNTLIDRRTLQLNRKVNREVAVRDRRAAARERDQSVLASPTAEAEIYESTVDITEPRFEVDELKEHTEEELKQHKAKTKEILEYFLGRLPDEQIHKVDLYFKKLEEEEEAAKAAKDKKKPTEKDIGKKPSSKPSRPDTASKAVPADPRPTSPPTLTSLIEGRLMAEVPICYNERQRKVLALNVIPPVTFPDPVTLPLPDDQVYQMLKKRETKKNKNKLDNFEIFTPNTSIKEEIVQALLNNEFKEEQEKKDADIEAINQKIEEQLERDMELRKEIEEREQELIAERQEAGDENAPRSEPTQTLSKSEEESPQLKALREEKKKIVSEYEAKVIKRRKELMALHEFAIDKEDLIHKYRWIIPKGKSLMLVIKFFSKKPGDFSITLDFDNIYSTGRLIHYKVKSLCDFPKICTQPAKIFANKRNNKPVGVAEMPNKVFYLEENRFDFGPLLTGKQEKDKQEKKMLQVNSSTFDIINEGSFKANINFQLASSVIEESDFVKGAFTYYPDHMELEPGASEKLRVWCIPQEVRNYTDEMICMIESNPSPYVIKMDATGVAPTLSTSTQLIEFDRLLLNQSFVKILTIKNIGALPSKWHIEAGENPHQFTFTPTSGELRPSKEVQVEIRFASDIQQKYEHEINIIATDVEGIGITQTPIPVMLRAEAFNINIKLDGFGNTENILNFGDLEVGRRIMKPFTIKNEGLYDIKYNFNIGRRPYRDNFKVQPANGDIKPGETKEIQVIFKCTEEIKIDPASMKSDIVLEVMEGKTSESFSKLPINVAVNAVYSFFSLNPPKQINFGPVKFNEETVRTFEIRNDGLFEFNYCIFDYADETKRKELKEEQEKLLAEMDTLVIDEKGKKGRKDEKPKKPAPAVKKGGVDPLALQVGQFTISPAFGVIMPNTATSVEVRFKAKGNTLYEYKVAIDVQNRNPASYPEGVPYELVAESCIPTINNSNFEVVFEEQIVIPSMQTTGKAINEVVSSNVFVSDERCFYFGTIIPSKYPEGVKERFKIVNNGKVHSELKFQIKRKAGSLSSDKDPIPFKLSPETAKIPPYEHIYVTVTFSPTIMATYAAQFEASVTNSDPAAVAMNSLTFDLRGEGAMPTLKLDKPKEFINDNTPVLKFPKTRLGKRVIESIVLKNDGVIPATVKFDVGPENPNFHFLSQTSYTLTPKSVQPFNIEFVPTAVGESTWEVVFNTLLNPYEQTKVIVKGESFFEGITFEGLPQDKDDQLIFGDSVIDVPKKVTFFIKNQTDDDLRISVDTTALDCVSIKPSVAHLAKRSTKAYHAILASNKKMNIDGQKIFYKTEKINQKEGKWVEWDNARKKRKMIGKTEDEWIKKCAEIEENFKKQEQDLMSRGKKVPTRPKDYLPQKPTPPADEKKDIEIEEALPEPTFESAGGDKKIEIQVFAKIDSPQFTCDTSSISFAPTMMYSSRVYDFKVKSDSITSLNYRWDVVDREDEVDPGYYKITPATGSIRPEGEETFQVRFSPMEIEENSMRWLKFTVANYPGEPHRIQLDSIAERPICHFETETSNYLNTRTGDIPEVDMAKIKVIEFESLGVKVKNRKRFYVVNPTATGYEFTWKKVDVDLGGMPNDSSFFTCAFEKGVILSGKKFEMIFEYKPEVTGLHESLWLFEIPSMRLKQYVLLVGKVIEPKVFFEVGKVDFGPLLLGGKHKESIKLKNLDYLPYHFNFSKSSIKGENDYGDSLSIEPMSGVIAGEGEVTLNVTFKPKVEGQYNYNIICNVAQKPRPLNLNVKGIGYILHHTVHLNNSPALVTPGLLSELDFGSIFVNERKTRTITVKNTGDFNFDFVIKKGPFQHVSIVPETATVKTGSKIDVEVIFNPPKEYKLRPNLHSLTLSIVSGPSYHFKLNGTARKPSVEVSFAQFDFGPCFVLKNPIKKTIVLKMKNNDEQAISIEPLFEKKNYIDVQLPPGQVLLPFDPANPETSLLHIPIVYTPREVKKMDELISFDINQLHKIDVRIMGEGVPLKLDLKRTEDSFVDFGIARIGSQHTALVGLANHSKAEVLISFDVDNQLQDLKKLCIRVKPDGNSKSAENDGLDGLRPVAIHPKESKEIEISFDPNTRLNTFRRELKYKIVENDEIVPLLTLQGACQGMDLKLMEEVLNFGSVVTGSKLTKKLQLNNMGDLGAKFEWDTTFCKPYFTITPKKGYLPPNDTLMFLVDFHPDVTEEHNFDIRCDIEGGNPIMVTLIGKGVAQVNEGIQTLKFETVVRTKTSQKVQVKNNVAERITIKANITTSNTKFANYFTGPETIQIGPNDKADYEVTYQPLTMTMNPKAPSIKEESHEGRLFFPMPDGSALIYNLSGKSNPPSAVESTSLSIKAKSDFTHTIDLKNWLKEVQRFNVTWELDTKDDTIIINGANTIDIPAESQKKYKLTLYGLKQGVNRLTVTFKNPNTQEFIFYVLNLTFTAPDAIESFELSSAVRETVKKVLTITNPLNKQVEIKKEQITVDTDTITFSPQNFTIPPKTEFGLELSFRPLSVAETKNTLKINSPDLGEFIYSMKLVGTATNVSRTLNFKAPLGTESYQTLKFRNYVKKAIPYTIKIERLGAQKPAGNVKETKNPQIEFTVDNATVQAPAADSKEGVEVPLNIKFEPSSMNESKALMTISSAEGGSYQYYLVGQTLNPQPKGPFKASDKVIPFKNPFYEPTEFMVRVDNPCFTTTVKNPMKLDAGKPSPIGFTYKAIPGYSSNGRLTVTAEGVPQWTFYLQGE